MPAPALAKTLSRGTAWMVASNIVTKGASLVTFAVVAGKLRHDEIGVWTMAFSFAAFTQFFRDGGVSQLLIQRGEKEYENLAGPVFWLALLFNVATAGVLAALAPFAASPWFYNEPRLLPLLLIMAATMPFMTPSTVLWVRLHTQLRFGAATKVTTISALIRYGGTIAFVLLGFGPMSFVLPLPLVAIYENAAFYAIVRDRPWARPPRIDLWGGLFKDSKWLVFVTLSFSVVNLGPFFVLGKLLTAEELGVFSMSFQMVTQIDHLLSATASAVLFAALAKLNEERERQRAATLRAARLMTLMSSIASLGLAATVRPLEQILWGGKWEPAVLPAQIVALVFAWRVLMWVPAPALQAQGRFRFSATLVLVAGIGLTVGAAIGAKVGGGSPVQIALGIAIFVMVGFLPLALWGLREVGVSRRQVLRQTVPTWLCVVLAGAGAIGVYELVHPHLLGAIVRPHLGLTNPWDAQALVRTWAMESAAFPIGSGAGGGYVGALMSGVTRLVWERRLVGLLDFLITGGAFALLTYATLRVFMRGLLQELAGVLPARLVFVRRFV